MRQKVIPQDAKLDFFSTRALQQSYQAETWTNATFRAPVNIACVREYNKAKI